MVDQNIYLHGEADAADGCHSDASDHASMVGHQEGYFACCENERSENILLDPNFLTLEVFPKAIVSLKLRVNLLDLIMAEEVVILEEEVEEMLEEVVLVDIVVEMRGQVAVVVGAQLEGAEALIEEIDA